MKKLLVFICVCTLVSGCKTARFSDHYKANLDQYSRLIGPVKDPLRYGDSLADKINQTIDKSRQSISKSIHTDAEGILIGGVGVLASKVLPIGTGNKNLIFSISIARNCNSSC